MQKFLFILGLSFFSGLAFGSEICGRQRSDIQQLLSHSSSRVAQRNGGGLFNLGVCWWHSRLQRSSVFLARYAPDQPRPTPEEAEKILESLRLMHRVVTIPGHANFESFTLDHPEQVQRLLDRWQKSDGFFHFSWIRGISGTSSLPPKQMRQQMQRIFRAYLSSPVPIWLMAQIRGISAHSVLVKKMSRTEQGFKLWVIDSNRPGQTLELVYQDGDRHIRTPAGNYTFVPYLGFQNDFRRMATAIREHCGKTQQPLIEQMHNLPAGDVELP
jgi:hypothetical protein